MFFSLLYSSQSAIICKFIATLSLESATIILLIEVYLQF